MNKKWLIDLCSLDGVSGREHAVRDYILNVLNSLKTPKDISVDAMGNVLVHLYGKEPANKTVLFDAHMDEVGFFITYINKDGSLCFDTVGGIDKSVLFGQKVRMSDVYGVIGGKAIHQCSSEEKESVPSVENMTIDIGAFNEDEAKSRINIGQEGTFAAELQEMQNGYLVGKALDDRVGCALLLSLAENQPDRDVWLSFSVQEEVGLRGAKIIAEEIKPQIAIAVDSTTAADIAECPGKNCVCRVGEGAVVSFADRATIYDTELYQHIRALAQANGIATQTKNKIAGGNNGASLQRGHFGAKTAAISLPCRYIHSPSCVANMSDIEAMEKLLKILVNELTAL